MTQKIIIIGGGIAGLAAAEAAKKQDAESQVILISQENDLPYYRLRAAEVLHKPEQAEKLYLHDQAWYEDKGIEVRLGTSVEEINTDEKLVILDSGQREAYDKLIITTGSKSREPSMPGDQRPNVFTLWTMDDARDFTNAIETTPIKSCAIVGGGVLGMEAAWQLHQRGVQVSILERGSYLMERQLSNQASEVLEAYIESLGMKVYTDADTTKILGEGEDGKVTGLMLADGRQIDCDAILFSIGVLANTELAEASGLEIGRRIKTDTHMLSSQPDIYAAGDVVEVDDGYWFGLWIVSMNQGKVAGTNAAGGDVEFEKTIHPYVVNTMKTRIISQGEFPTEEEGGQRKVTTDPEDPYSYKETYYKDGKLVGFMLIGDAAKEMIALQGELKDN